MRWTLPAGRTLVLTTFAVAAGLGLLAVGDRQPRSSPDEPWEETSPAEAGLDPVGLRRLARFVGGHGFVTRSGARVHAWGDPTARVDVKSAGKPIIAHLLLDAVQRGEIPHLDQRVHHWEPALADLNPNLDFKDRAITWRHLVNQVSGYGVVERPGEAFAYNDYQTALLFDLLMRHVYEVDPRGIDPHVFLPRLARPIGCEDAPTLTGSSRGPGRLVISMRDFARFGVLYMNGGLWRGRRLLDDSLVRMATDGPVPVGTPRTSGRPAAMLDGQRSIGGGRDMHHHHGSYSFLWWLNGIRPDGRRKWPDAPADTFAALGWWGRTALVVLPDEEIVLAWSGTFPGTEPDLGVVNEAVRILLAGRAERLTFFGD